MIVRALVTAALLAALASCPAEGPGAPTLDAVEPAQAETGAEVELTLRGQGFYLSAQQQLSGDEAIRVDARFRVILDGPLGSEQRRRVVLDEVTYVDATTLRATVPASIAVGRHDVLLFTPCGPAALDAGYEALPATTVFVDGGSSDVGSSDVVRSDVGLPDTAAPDTSLPDVLGPDVSDAGLPLEIIPSNGIDPTWLDETTASITVSANRRLNTDNGTSNGIPFPFFHVVTQQQDCGSEPVEIGVFAFAQLTVLEGATLRIIGSRAAAIVASGPVEVHGVIDASGGSGACPVLDLPTCAGPGGFPGGQSENPGEDGQGPGGGGGGFGDNQTDGLDEMGGGGGGHGGLGGEGGDETEAPFLLGGAGGTSYEGRDPLCGGSGGGGGGAGSLWDPAINTGAEGGGGGGALQLFSRDRISVSGSGAGINAGGGGGRGDKEDTYDDGAGGGGAGGTVLLEAPRVELLDGALLAANGGGGGGRSSRINVDPGDDGETGLLSDQSAAGGAGGGGEGGALADPDGQDGRDYRDGTCGGGGGAGQVHIITYDDAQFTNAGSVSPAPTTAALDLQ